MEHAKGEGAANFERDPIAADKKPYEAPTIEDFGSVEDLTAGGNGAMAEVPSNGYSTTAM